MKLSDVLIIGGGVIGSSIAYHLAIKGGTKIIVIDKNPVAGLGSTGKATGGFRCQFATDINIRLSLLSRKKLLTFKEDTGFDPGFIQAGYLFIASNKSELEALYGIQNIQIANGLLEVQKVIPGDIENLNPFIILNDYIKGGVFSSTDGFIKPLNILNGYKSAAERLGVEFLYSTECLGFNFSSLGKKITKAVTSEGDIGAEYFINAAGAWAKPLAKQAGIDLPVNPQRREIAVLNETNLFSENMPMTIYINDGFHFRQREGKILLLYPEISDSDLFNTTVDDYWLEKVKSIADERIKNIAAASVNKKQCLSGLYEVSPDKHAIVGTYPELNNFYFANGSSGHGVMHSPAIGEIISELVIRNSFDKFNIHPLRPTRFRENDLNFSSEYL